ncbi:MAG: 50S ribosomal protein L18 [Eubacteriales bacterium]|nr:50S ribosomal protein L18 [Eubacteriales bacterium]
MVNKINKKEIRQKKHLRERNRFFGTPEKPRLTVFRSDMHMYAQVIDDTKGVTLCATSTLDKSLGLKKTNNKEAASAIGEAIAKKAKELGITKIVFDRSGYIYHGKVEALAEAARKAGLEF